MIWLRDYAAIAAILALVAGALVIVLNDRRWMLLMLACVYVALTWLTAISLPIQVSAVKLVGGMMTCAVLALSIMRVGHESEIVEREGLPSGIAFRVIAVLLVSASAWGLAERGWMLLPGSVSLSATLGAMLLLSLGLLHLGISEEPFRVGMGLLTALAGFEILYVAVEPSLAVLALMAAVHIGIAILVSYLVVGAAVLRSGGRP
jgi:hypothetical protein